MTAAPRRVTLREVAAELEVSAKTVSNAYTRPDQLSDRLRTQILATAARLGYPGPDPLAAGLRRGRVGAIGLAYANRLSYAFEDPVAVALLAGVTSVAEPAGTGLLLVPGSATPERSAAAVNGAVIDGLIACSLADDDPLLAAALPPPLPLTPPAGTGAAAKVPGSASTIGPPPGPPPSISSPSAIDGSQSSHSRCADPRSAAWSTSEPSSQQPTLSLAAVSRATALPRSKAALTGRRYPLPKASAAQSPKAKPAPPRCLLPRHVPRPCCASATGSPKVPCSPPTGWACAFPTTSPSSASMTRHPPPA